MKHRRLITGAAAGALVLVLTGCVPNTTGSPSSGSTVKVAASDKACDLSTTTAPSGPVTFT